ncbi:hypothetical protein WR25_04957 [Diploscapter pachys]|uniref:Uncharacterized protein n=1 Tax=Diploscapter pachys TaxID=2018661 RepID=A0A2A2JQQ2_9BILA|nr:hypothetical protein WR25_04957 [Diploscapter pachys]
MLRCGQRRSSSSSSSSSGSSTRDRKPTYQLRHCLFPVWGPFAKQKADAFPEAQPPPCHARIKSHVRIRQADKKDLEKKDQSDGHQLEPSSSEKRWLVSLSEDYFRVRSSFDALEG